jgi:hypothetical protein
VGSVVWIWALEDLGKTRLKVPLLKGDLGDRLASATVHKSLREKRVHLLKFIVVRFDRW